MRKTAATRTTTASRPLLESQTTISHAELAALPDANPRGARRSNPGAPGRPCVRVGSRYRERSSIDLETHSRSKPADYAPSERIISACRRCPTSP
jgi:hypothetical protein